MAENRYKADLNRLVESETFAEASATELRVLLAIISRGGAPVTEAKLAKLAGVSVARCVSAIALFREAGILTDAQHEGGNAVVIDEFEHNPLKEIIDEENSVDVAKTIRNENLADLIAEITIMMNRSNLNTNEIKNITALHTQHSLSQEYILTLAAHLQEKKGLTAKKLATEAVKLVEKGIDTVEALSVFIGEKEQQQGYEWEFRRLIGIWGRNLAPTEKKLFKRWAEEYGYSVGIVGLAFDIAVRHTAPGALPLDYMETVLSAWHEAGCKTVEECKSNSEAFRLQKTAEREADQAKKTSPHRRKNTPAAEEPKYADFNSEDALMKALKRSYGNPEDNE